MSAHEHEVVEPKSSIKVTRNAKGEPQWDVKVVAGADEGELNAMRQQAVAQHRALERELIGGAP